MALCILQYAGEAHYLTRNTQDLPHRLRAVFKQHLQTDADTQKMLGFCRLYHRTAQTAASSSRIQSGIAPCPGNTHAGCPITPASSVTTIFASGADVAYGLFDRAQVAHAVSTIATSPFKRPFGGGHHACMRGPASKAMRNARPNALNIVCRLMVRV